MAKYTLTVTLEVDAHPLFRRAELVNDIREQVKFLREPEPTRKAGRSAWNVTSYNVVFETVGDGLAAEQEMCGCHEPSRPVLHHASRTQPPGSGGVRLSG